jgi:hypothetical protein
MQVQRLAATYRALIDGLKAMSPAGRIRPHRAAHARPLQRNLFRARLPGALPGPDPGRRQRPDRARPALSTSRPCAAWSRCTACSSAWTTNSWTRWNCARLHAGRARPAAGDSRRQRAGGQCAGLGLSGVQRAAGLSAGAVAPPAGRGPAMLPALPTWWCGERAMEAVLPQLDKCVIKPTYPGSASHGISTPCWGARCRAANSTNGPDASCARANPHHPGLAAAVADADLAAAHGGDRIEPRSVMLRVFAVADGPQSWRVLPGGLARLASASEGIVHAARRQQRRCLGADPKPARRWTAPRCCNRPSPDPAVASSASAW